MSKHELLNARRRRYGTMKRVGSYRELVTQRRAANRAEAQRLMRALAPDGENAIKARIVACSERLGWPYGRTEDIWRGQARRIEAWEMDDLRDLTTRNDSPVP